MLPHPMWGEGLDLMVIVLTRPAFRCWDYRCEPPSLTRYMVLNRALGISSVGQHILCAVPPILAVLKESFSKDQLPKLNGLYNGGTHFNAIIWGNIVRHCLKKEKKMKQAPFHTYHTPKGTVTDWPTVGQSVTNTWAPAGDTVWREDEKRLR